MENYEINKNTLAIIPINETTSKIYESDACYTVNKSSFEIIENSCKYFGSSYAGRCEGTKNLIKMNYKLPIIVEETMNIIFFPTNSPRTEKCSWISLNNLKDYKKTEFGSTLIFKNDNEININESVYIVENQILRASRLQYVIHNRKK